MNEQGGDKKISEKSKRLLNAIGGIEDRFIDEAANREDKVTVEYGEPTTVFAEFKNTIPAKLAACAACVCLVILAVLFFTQTVPFMLAEPATLVFPEITVSDFDDYFELEKMDWDNSAVFLGYNLTEGSKFYYFNTDAVTSDEDSITYVLSVYDRETGENRELLSIVCAKEDSQPHLLYVYDNFLYFLLYESYIGDDGYRNGCNNIYRLNLTDGSEEKVLAFDRNTNVDLRDYKIVQIGNCMYFNAQSRWVRGIYCYNIEEKNIFLFRENAQCPELYKDGIIYYRGKAVYYVKNPNESVKKTENTLDGTAEYRIEGEKKLFDLDTESENCSLYYNGKQIYFIGSRVINDDPDDLGNWIDVYGCDFGVYEKNGKVKPIARFEVFFDPTVNGGDLLIAGGYIYDPKNNVFAEIPKEKDDAEQFVFYTFTTVSNGDIVRGVFKSKYEAADVSDMEEFEVYRVVRK